MSNDFAFAVSLVSSVAIVALVVAVVLMARAMSVSFSAGMRSVDRQRHSADAMVARLIEKMTLDPARAAQIHAQERVAESRIDASLEREAIRAESPKRGETPGSSGDLDVDEAEAVYQ